MINKKTISFAINIFIFVSTMVMVINNLFHPIGLTQFRYFTVLSNILLAVSALLFVVFYNKNYKLFYKLYFFANIFTTITFLTVVFYLAPINEHYFSLFKGTQFFMHFLSPVLGIVSLLLNKQDINYKQIYLGAIFVLIYGCFYFSFVFTNIWPDFYLLTNSHNIFAAIIAVILFMALYAIIANSLYYFVKKVSVKHGK